jgi:hypothetical protein
MWDIRSYAILCCVGLLARWSYSVALNELNGDFTGWGALVALWIPVAVLSGIVISLVVPAVKGRVSQYRRRLR